MEQTAGQRHFFFLISLVGGLAIFSSTMSKTPVLPLEPPPVLEALPWGTPAARRAEIERVRRQIEENAARRKAEENGRSS